MSALRQTLEEYLALRRSLGHQLADAGRLLPRFVAHLEATAAQFVTIESALAWAQEPEAGPGSTVWAARMMAVRGFARYMAGIDPRTEVPPAGLIRRQSRWKPPFIFSEADVRALMGAARQMISQPMRAATYETLIGLLAATGLRVGEALRLDRTDVDWSEGVLLVRQSKFGKSREVPLLTSTVDALRAYADERDHVRSHASTPAFFVSLRGTRVIYEVAHPVFRQLCDATGVGSGSARRPRIHDLRHSFAVNTLVRWYRDGINVQTRLSWLSTYLGHREPRYTYWYLSAAPELLANAASRLEASLAVAQ